MVTWLFDQWMIDFLNPFPIVPSQLKSLIMAINYFTKWIDTEPLITITTQNIQKFILKHIICQFEIPNVLILDNRTQFCTNNFREYCEDLQMKQKFALVEHPQMSGLIESINLIILGRLNKKLNLAKGR